MEAADIASGNYWLLATNVYANLGAAGNALTRTWPSIHEAQMQSHE